MGPIYLDGVVVLVCCRRWSQYFSRTVAHASYTLRFETAQNTPENKILIVFRQIYINLTRHKKVGGRYGFAGRASGRSDKATHCKTHKRLRTTGPTEQTRQEICTAFVACWWFQTPVWPTFQYDMRSQSQHRLDIKFCPREKERIHRGGSSCIPTR